MKPEDSMTAKSLYSGLPRTFTFEELNDLKAQNRRSDRQRLLNGEDPWRIQRENSVFPTRVTSFRILHFAET